ncbi:hypothetical protein J3459_014026 [Metarhizium acridum]|nr:hypothetical protein J3459_014026 [Metarhizium acridum]
MSLPVGPLVSPREAVRPPHEPLHGQTTSLVPLEAGHAAGLFRGLGGPENYARWTYMLTGGFPTLADCQREIDEWSRDTSSDRLYYTVLSGPASSPRSEPVGIMCYLAVVPPHRRLEIGGVILARRCSGRGRQPRRFIPAHQACVEGPGLPARRVEGQQVERGELEGRREAGVHV